MKAGLLDKKSDRDEQMQQDGSANGHVSGDTDEKDETEESWIRFEKRETSGRPIQF